MKKSIIIICLLAVAAVCVAWFVKDDGVMTKQGSTYVIDTKPLTKKVIGYAGATPLRIHISKDKIVKIETQPNEETPQYFKRAATLLKKYEGKTVKQAQSMHVDAVTGATYSSKALLKNVETGLEYYQKHK